MPGRCIAQAAVLAGVLLVGKTAFGQPFIQIGSSGETSGVREGWILGGGYDFDFPVLPFEVGGMVQGGSGVETEDSGREFPVRAFLTAKMGMLPLPGFSVYVGGGAGVSSRFGGDAEAGTVAAGMAMAGFETGRLHLEVQLQRELHEEPVNRWVTVIGLTF